MRPESSQRPDLATDNPQKHYHPITKSHPKRPIGLTNKLVLSNPQNDKARIPPGMAAAGAGADLRQLIFKKETR